MGEAKRSKVRRNGSAEGKRSSNNMLSRLETNGLCIRLHWEADLMKHGEAPILHPVADDP
jgi:hypothetical protein